MRRRMPMRGIKNKSMIVIEFVFSHEQICVGRTMNTLETEARSPLSKAAPKKVRDLSKAFILEQLERYYGARPPEGAVENDYVLYECAETGLQFSWPQRPGNSIFYAWLAGFDSYYPGVRWEYGMVDQLLNDNPNPRILDVGCGKGDFLRNLGNVSSDNKAGLGLNAPAIEACRRAGLRTFCGTIETAMSGGFLKPREFSHVTSFHCLEHVVDPVGFMRSLLAATAPGGSVFVSTPYSPMSFESHWFDIMNHPPHHLGRWNLKAYRRLAEILGAKMTYFTPSSAAFQRALNLFRLVRYGPNRPIGKARLAKDLIVHCREFVTYC